MLEKIRENVEIFASKLWKLAEQYPFEMAATVIIIFFIGFAVGKI